MHPHRLKNLDSIRTSRVCGRGTGVDDVEVRARCHLLPDSFVRKCCDAAADADNQNLRNYHFKMYHRSTGGCTLVRAPCTPTCPLCRRAPREDEEEYNKEVNVREDFLTLLRSILDSLSMKERTLPTFTLFSYFASFILLCQKTIFILVSTINSGGEGVGNRIHMMWLRLMIPQHPHT